MQDAPQIGPDVAAFERSFHAGRQLTVVDADRLCTDCGYPMRGQPVRVEPMSRMPMCRCPDCGRFMPGDGVTAPSERVLRRLAAPLLVGWLFALLVAGALAGFGMFMGQIILYQWIDHSVPYGDALVSGFLLGGTLTVLCAALLPLALALTSSAGHLVRLLLVGLLPLALAILFTELMVISASSTSWQAERLYTYRPLRFLLYTLAALTVFGVLSFARPIGRLVIGTLLPSGLITVFAHLWTRDGKTPPVAERG